MLVLVAGGPAAGKATICREIAETISKEDPEIVVEQVNMQKWHRNPYKPDVDFDGLLTYLQGLDPSNIILLHGKYALYDEKLRSLAALKIFVDTDSDEQLSQWLLRDKNERKIDEILNEYLNYARVDFIDNIVDTKEHADVLLPRGKGSLGTTTIAMNVVDQLKQVQDGSYGLRSAKKIDLRRELFEELDGRYYAAT